VTYNDQYSSRQETKLAHQAAESIGLDFDSHTLRPLVVEFIKNKKPVAVYDIVKGLMTNVEEETG